jgi:hypothetical protein
MNKFDLDLIHYKLQSLRSEGYFVSISPKEEDYIIECRIYITDRDDETGIINVLELREGQVRDENNKCLGCKSVPGEVRILTRGCISCPLACGSFTRPFALTEKVYRAKLGSSLGSMPSQMASTISAALK